MKGLIIMNDKKRQRMMAVFRVIALILAVIMILGIIMQGTI